MATFELDIVVDDSAVEEKPAASKGREEEVQQVKIHFDKDASPQPQGDPDALAAPGNWQPKSRKLNLALLAEIKNRTKRLGKSIYWLAGWLQEVWMKSANNLA